jgi:hypothetical protein
MLITLKSRPTGNVHSAGGPADEVGDPLLDRLWPDERRELGCELVWATTWVDDANEVIWPRLGLAQWPVVAWPHEDGVVECGLHVGGEAEDDTGRHERRTDGEPAGTRVPAGSARPRDGRHPAPSNRPASPNSR